MATYPFQSFTPPWASPSTSTTGGPRSSYGNPFQTVYNEKSPDIGSRLDELFKDFDVNKGASAGAIGRYSDILAGNTPQIRAQTLSDLGLANRIMSGGTASDLAGIRARRADAITGALGQSQKELRRTLSLDQLSQGGGGRALGMSGYLAKLATNKLADLSTKAAIDAADQERADYETNQKLQLGMLGQRQPLLDRLAGRELLPQQAQDARLATILQMLAQLQKEQEANAFYGLRKPFGY